MPWTKWTDSTGVARVAFVQDGQALLTDEEDLLRAVDSGIGGLNQIGTAAIDELNLAPLIVDPPSIRDFMAFEEHVVTAQRARGLQVHEDWYRIPVFYFTNPAAAKGPRTEIAIPPGTEQFDFEFEVAVLIGCDGSDIPVAEAEKHIAGLMVMSDWSSRDVQMREMTQGIGPSKGKDAATSFGHFLVPIEELEPRRKGKAFDVELRASVNGTIYSAANLSTIYWSLTEMVAHASVGTRLRRGDVIGTGTVGTGCIFELAAVHGAEKYPYLRPDDVVILDGGPLGSIQARIGAPAGGDQLFPRR